MEKINFNYTLINHLISQNLNSPPPCDDLEKELFDFTKCIKYQKITASFQVQLKKNTLKIKTSTNVFAFTDKTTNIYKVRPQNYKKVLKENMTRTYKKCSTRLEKVIKLEAKQIAKK